MRLAGGRSNIRRVSSATATAPGKVILIGEHFVVLGASALSTAISLHSTAHAIRSEDGRVEVEATVPVSFVGQREREGMEPEKLLRPLRSAAQATLRLQKRGRNAGARVQVESEIPMGAGLGSSASASVAIITAVAASQGRKLARKQIFELAYEPERIVHTKPSGIDQATATYGGIIEYRRGGVIDRVKPSEELRLVICDTGLHRSTGRLVGGVVRRSRKLTEGKDYRERVRAVTLITREARRALEHGEPGRLGELMNANQTFLRDIGVSHPFLDRLVLVARRAGALGAKLTGAGGGGCMIALCEDESSRRRVARSLERMGGLVYAARLSVPGVSLAG